MSLNQKVNSLIEEHVRKFIKQVSATHSIEEDKLWGLWSDEKIVKNGGIT